MGKRSLAPCGVWRLFGIRVILGPRMKNIAMIAAAGLLAGVLAVAFRILSGESRGDAMGLLASGVDGVVTRWAAEKIPLERRLLTIVLSDPYSGNDPFPPPGRKPKGGFLARLFSEPGGDAFTRAFENDPFHVVLNLAIVMRPEDSRPLAGLERVLAKASAAGRVRIIAHGDATAMAVLAAIRAGKARGPGAPLVERLVGIGTNRVTLSKRYPRLAEELPRLGPAAFGEWINLWSDPGTVPRTLQLELWRPGYTEFWTAERPYPKAAWKAIVQSAAEKGADAFPAVRIDISRKPRMRRFRDITGRAFQKSASQPRGRRRPKPVSGGSLDMLAEGNKRKEAPPREADLSGEHPIWKTHWTMKKLPNFQLMSGHDAAAMWAEGPYRIDVFRGVGGSGGAKVVCARSGNTLTMTEHSGQPAAACLRYPTPETGRPNAYSDTFTIYDRAGYHVSVAYMYDHLSKREGKLDFYHSVIGFLHRGTRLNQ